MGRRLWPYVRYFGLCGADPAAVESVAELAAILGLNSPAGPLAREAIDQTREQTVNEAVELVAESLRGRILSREIEPFCDRIRQSLLNRSGSDQPGA